nr:immunoglobulin heavy chain junction region [Mus musculus]
SVQEATHTMLWTT